MKLNLTVLMMSFMILCGACTYSQNLDIILVAESDSKGSAMGAKVFSPGDYDGDGYPEIFVLSYDSNYVCVYDGGNPPADTPQKIYQFNDLRGFSILDDINGDGKQEVAFRLNVGNFIYSVDIYLSEPDFYSKSEPDISILGASNQHFGKYVIGTDTDADGENELVIAAPNSSSYPIMGRFYIYEAGTDLDSIPEDILEIDTNFIYNVIIGHCLGDINGDNYADYAVSDYNATPSIVMIFYGSADLDSVPDHVITSPWGNNRYGRGFVPLGDINRDGYDDFIILSTLFHPALMYYGGNPFDTVPLYLEYGGECGNRIGDINHDGWDDIAIGSPQEAAEYGRVYVFYGYSPMDTIADIIIEPLDVPDVPVKVGRGVGPAGDFNDDGIDDLAIGASTSFTDFNDYGHLIVFAGNDTLPTSVDDEQPSILPERYNLLEQNHPNPFNQKTSIRYDLFGYSERPVELLVYNILGERIRTLVSGRLSGGDHLVQWDGRNSGGDTVSSGLYFYTLRANGQQIVKKMLFLK